MKQSTESQTCCPDDLQEKRSDHWSGKESDDLWRLWSFHDPVCRRLTAIAYFCCKRSANVIPVSISGWHADTGLHIEDWIAVRTFLTNAVKNHVQRLMQNQFELMPEPRSQTHTTMKSAGCCSKSPAWLFSHNDNFMLFRKIDQQSAKLLVVLTIGRCVLDVVPDYQFTSWPKFWDRRPAGTRTFNNVAVLVES